MYALLRALAGVALRWFYRSIQVDGRERIPRRGPVLFVVNHPNALVDAMLVGWAVPRRVLLTAKATLFGNPFGAMLLRWVGVVPLRRASDEKTVREPLDPSRNEDTFLAVRTAFQAGRAVLIFPEGKSHDEPAMAPLRTGAARMALDAWNSGAAPMLSIVPVGLTFERKDTPRTRVLVQVGEPLRLERWCDVQHARPVEELTAEIDARLRVVTRNYASADEAARVVRLASTIAALIEYLSRQHIELRAHARNAPRFDAGWSRNGDVFVAEVKSLTGASEDQQIRLGIGQVLDYAHQLQLARTYGRIRPVLVLEKQPTDPRWTSLAEASGILLTWAPGFAGC